MNPVSADLFDGRSAFSFCLETIRTIISPRAEFSGKIALIAFEKFGNEEEIC